MFAIKPQQNSLISSSYQQAENDLGKLNDCRSLSRSSGNSDIKIAEFENKTFILKKTSIKEKLQYDKLRSEDRDGVLIKSYNDDFVNSKIVKGGASLPDRVEGTLVMDKQKDILFDYKLGNRTAGTLGNTLSVGKAHKKDTMEMTSKYSFRDTAKGAPTSYTEIKQSFESKVISPVSRISIFDSLSKIEQFIEKNDLSYRGASVVICHNEETPFESKAFLIDLAHPHDHHKSDGRHDLYKSGMLDGIKNIKKMVAGDDKGIEMQELEKESP